MLKHENNHAVYPVRMLVVRGFMLAAFILLNMYALNIDDKSLIHPVLAGFMLLWGGLSIPLLRSRNAAISTDWLAGHILADVLMLTVLLYFTGGYTNPLISFYLFPVLIAGLMLSRRKAWMIGAIVITSYTLLLKFYAPFSLFGGDHMANGSFHAHLLGMWLTFVLSVLVIMSVVVRMAEQRRQHERQLSELYQRASRDRNMLALGAQAASDAHELGTPVNSLLLLLDQWNSAKLDNKTVHRIEKMRKQLAHCRTVLNRLSQRANALCKPEDSLVQVDTIVKDSVQKWCNLHPNLTVRTGIPERVSPFITLNPVLEQAIFLLLDNARESGATSAVVQLRWDDKMFNLRICDNGCGFAASLLPHIGLSPISDKPEGGGIGLYMLRYMIENMGGKLTAFNDSTGGACVELNYPVGEGIK